MWDASGIKDSDLVNLVINVAIVNTDPKAPAGKSPPWQRLKPVSLLNGNATTATTLANPSATQSCMTPVATPPSSCNSIPKMQMDLLKELGISDSRIVSISTIKLEEKIVIIKCQTK
jgi:hypothetical protein